jgi:1-aminocyclopropane-1-carboxylate deaminase/D-cysteine desulfhydrase-like pyridoxal-dependent ACC family enzyme
LQGNKLRKLEFLFADALVNHKAKHILTAGGLQSNHCRAVAALANRFGLKSHLFLRSHTNKPFDLNFNGNRE